MNTLLWIIAILAIITVVGHGIWVTLRAIAGWLSPIVFGTVFARLDRRLILHLLVWRPLVGSVTIVGHA